MTIKREQLNMTHLVSTTQLSVRRALTVVLVGLVLTIWPAVTSTAFGAQDPKAKNLNSVLPQPTVPVQESKIKDPDAALTSTGFSYQGQLKDANGPVTGAFDFQFVLYSTQPGGERLGANEMKDMALTNGMFSFKLDFGHAALEAKESWLEIGIRPSGGAEPYTLLFPRQKLTPTPYAIFAQHEQWSLIGVPVGFAGSAEKVTVITDELADQGVTDAKKVSEETAKSSDSLKAKATDAESKAAAPNGVEWTQTGLNLYPTILGSNVGIGTMAPDTRLNVNSSAANSQAVLTVSNGNADTRLALWSGLSAGANPPAILYTHDLRFGTVTAANFATGAGFAEAMRITRGGEVTIGNVLHLNNISGCAAGIGVVAPFNCLNYMLVGQPNGSTFINSSGAGNIHFRHNNGGVNNADQMEIRADNGEVTIGNVLHLNNISGCAAGIGVVAPFNCSNYMIVGQPNGSTFINSSGAGSIHFRHDNGGVDNADQMEIRADGTTVVKVLQINGADIAEPFNLTDAHAIEPGMLVAIDANNPGHLRMADKAYDRTVAGIVSGANGINTAVIMKQEGTLADGSHLVALSGRVYCWADVSNGPIEPGDLLTTSDTSGHAMKVTDHVQAQGAIIGKAMTSLKEGKGLVLVLVTLQ